MKSEVFNTDLSSAQIRHYPSLNETQRNNIVAGLFEQLMLFDKAVIRTNRSNHALIFLIHNLGLTTVEKLLDFGYIDILLWTPVIASGGGLRREDGSIDESVIYSQPPIVAGSMSDEDKDPEKNIEQALHVLGISREKARPFMRKARKRYVVPDGMGFSKGAAEFVLNAYETGGLSSLGLPSIKGPMELDLDERGQLLDLSSKVLESALLGKYGYKSFNNYEHFELGRQNIQRIGKAYQVVENAENLFTLEKIPNLKKLFLEERMQFEDLFSLRHKSNAKYFRKWLNQVSEYTDSAEITTEYLKELKGLNNPTSSDDKFIKTLSVFLAGTGLGTVLNPVTGMLANAGLSFLDSYWIDGLVSGKKPSMFIEEVRKKIS
jgi:hypothetical protein